MLYMNEYDIANAAERYADHEVLADAVRTLENLVDWTNRNSDGWAYWPKPCRAAERLQRLIGTTREYLDNPGRPDATAERYRAAVRPIKAFRTRRSADFTLAEEDRAAHEVERTERERAAREGIATL